MRFTSIASALAVAAGASAQLTYNITAAYAEGNFAKYRCLDNTKLSSWLPECLHACQDSANKRDGCAPDDFACHCVNYSVYEELVQPCAFPASMGGQGTCTLEELGKARPIIDDMCNFFNATLYAAYGDCKQELSKKKTYGIVCDEETIVSY